MKKLARFDFTSNSINQGMREGVEEAVRNHLVSLVPSIVDRQGKLPPYITMEVGFYTNLMEEARRCYEFGLFHATVSMIGIAAERFCMELSDYLKFFVNEKQISEKELYNKGFNHYRRLLFLLKAQLITKDTYNLLDEIRTIRNKYIHPSEIEDVEEDAIIVIKKFNEIIKSRFSERYEIREGKIVPR